MPLFQPWGYTYLGEVTASAAVRTGVLASEDDYDELFFEYFINGYDNVAIGRLIVGPAAGLSETGTTFCATHRTNISAVTTSVSIPGWPTFGGAADNVARWGQCHVTNNAAAVKRMWMTGMNAGTVPTTAPTLYDAAGLFNDSTNRIKRAELAVYDVITGAVVSSRVFNAGTYLRAWGLKKF